MTDLAAAEIPASWTFQDARVAASFDAHVRTNLPFYDLVSQFVAAIAKARLPRDGVLVDLGSSTGNVIRHLAEAIDEREAWAHAVEPAAEMRALFAPHTERCSLHGETAEAFFPAAPGLRKVDVVTAVLTLMFVPVFERAPLLLDAAARLRPGGCLVIVDKDEILPPLADAAKAHLLERKLAAGCTAEAVLGKELSLRGVQRPLRARWLRRLLEQEAGLEVQEFFRWGAFYGLVGYRD